MLKRKYHVLFVIVVLVAVASVILLQLRDDDPNVGGPVENEPFTAETAPVDGE